MNPALVETLQLMVHLQLLVAELVVYSYASPLIAANQPSISAGIPEVVDRP